MPIKWSALEVMEKLNEIEALLKEISPVLDQCSEKAREVTRITNIPHYISEPAWGIAWGIAYYVQQSAVPRIYGYVGRIRKKIPQEAIELERQRGKQNQPEL